MIVFFTMFVLLLTLLKPDWCGFWTSQWSWVRFPATEHWTSPPCFISNIFFLGILFFCFVSRRRWKKNRNCRFPKILLRENGMPPNNQPIFFVSGSICIKNSEPDFFSSVSRGNQSPLQLRKLEPVLKWMENHRRSCGVEYNCNKQEWNICLPLTSVVRFLTLSIWNRAQF